MRTHATQGINYPLLLAVLALHAGVFAWALRQPAFAPSPQRTAARAETAPPGNTTPRPDAQRRSETAVTDDEIPAADDPRRAFTPQQWRDNQQRAAAALLQRELGALAAVAARDPAQLPRALEQGLARGDRAAAQAAAALHEECSQFDAAALQSAPPILLQDIAAPLQPLLRARFDARLQRLREQARRCAAWNQAQATLATARRDYAGRANADAHEALRVQQQLQPATPDLLARLRQGLEQVWRQNSDAAVGRNLALLLLNEDDATRRELGLRLLLQLGEQDDSQADFVAAVLNQGYGKLPRQPVLAATWQRRAADLGSDSAIGGELQQEPVRASAEQAWSWRAWRVWLNAQGCYVRAARADDALLADDLRALQQLDTQLDAAARGRAGRLYRERLAQWGERARTARHCGNAPATER
ncbi:hypothetical protein [Tahibacter harae]|uniref:Uncharacterized protein n=1 Tax=Tahibacter harae TaxID=2963937 RepID=A0ABT1QMV2_9GAMM|nr:hypothetical protein [Tahibacter harae]MCQ4163866.1 hypothetical protein [Tahibacter harae]